MGEQFARETARRGRIFAFLRVLLFIVLAIAAALGSRPVAVALHKLFAIPHASLLIDDGVLAVAVLALTALLARMSGRRVTDYGLGGTARALRFGTGALAGFAFLSVLLLVMHALGLFEFGSMRAFSPSLLSDAALFAAAFLAVGVSEETLFRGYVLVELSRAVSFWPAAVVWALLFALPHALQAGDNALGGFEAGLFAFAAAAAFRWTGSLWLAIGYHAAWDFGESFVYGVPDSGQVTAERLFHPAIHGPVWLSGGSAGPEGSVLATLPMLALLALAWALRARNGSAIRA